MCLFCIISALRSRPPLMSEPSIRWEVLQSLPFDWKIISGRRGCRWGAAIIYFPLRSLSMLYFACSILLLYPPPWQPKHASDVRYVIESAAMISRTCAYHILALHMSSVWNRWNISWPLCATIVALWVINAFGISRMQSPWFFERLLTICYGLSALPGNPPTVAIRHGADTSTVQRPN
ncbi:hypothetical protein BC835DRAFT_674847 [Cytidiella melzeri]|nr:hypothetical protein BC835DRAFT_674847 [Cytidiella melzeri]